MTFTLEINCNNAAFDDEGHAEVARILRELAERLEADESIKQVPLQDINGNRVGLASFQGAR
jgi:hypothetical protein